MSLFHIDAGREWREPQRQILVLARKLREKGYIAHFVVPPGSALGGKAAEAGLTVTALDAAAGLGFAGRLGLARAMRRRGCVLVHFHDLASAAACGKAAIRAKVPLRVLSPRADSGGRAPRLEARDYDAFVVPSAGAKDVLVRGGIPEPQIDVIPGGIDFGPFEDVKERDFLRREFGFGADDFLVGIVAHLDDERGVRSLLEAAVIVTRHAPKIKLIILGEGSLRLGDGDEPLDRAAGSFAYYLGFRDDAAKVLASLNLFIMSSHLRGLGGPILDAMASKLPVIATQVAGVPEFIVHRESGLLVPPRDPKSLADAVLKVYLDRNLANRLAAAGYDSAYQKFSTEAKVLKIIELYERLASRKGVKLG